MVQLSAGQALLVLVAPGQEWAAQQAAVGRLEPKEQHWPVVPQQHSQYTEAECTEGGGSPEQYWVSLGSNHSGSSVGSTSRSTAGMWCRTGKIHAASEPGEAKLDGSHTCDMTELQAGDRHYMLRQQQYDQRSRCQLVRRESMYCPTDDGNTC